MTDPLTLGLKPEENEALLDFIHTKRPSHLREIYTFMQDSGMFANCIVIVDKGVLMVQRVIGW
jgi:hypothetical protein